MGGKVSASRVAVVERQAAISKRGFVRRRDGERMVETPVECGLMEVAGRIVGPGAEERLRRALEGLAADIDWGGGAGDEDG